MIDVAVTILRRAMAAFCISGIASAALAKPAVFIPPEKGSAWWTTKSFVRPMGKSIDGIPIETLNAFRSEAEPAEEKLCFVEGVERDTYAGLSRQVQAEIDTTLAALKHDPFRQAFSIPGGRGFIARSAIGEECETATKIGIVVIYDATTRQIAELVTLEDNAFNFLWPGKSPAMLGFSGCFECGDWHSVYYDVTRRKFYWQSEGD